MLQLPKRLDYAIRGVYYLASVRRPVFVREISARENIPQTSLAKIFQVLARRGILSSTKGRSGGFLLTLPPEMITIAKIVDAVEGTVMPESCPFVDELCGRDKSACPIYQSWRAAAYEMTRRLESVTLQDLIEGRERSLLAATTRRKKL